MFLLIKVLLLESIVDGREIDNYFKKFKLEDTIKKLLENE